MQKWLTFATIYTLQSKQRVPSAVQRYASIITTLFATFIYGPTSISCLGSIGAYWQVCIYCESKKLDRFSFEHNFGKYCPILIILSLLQTEINYNQVYPEYTTIPQVC